MKVAIMVSLLFVVISETEAIRHRKKNQNGIFSYAASLYSDLVPKISHELVKYAFNKLHGPNHHTHPGHTRHKEHFTGHFAGHNEHIYGHNHHHDHHDHHHDHLHDHHNHHHDEDYAHYAPVHAGHDHFAHGGHFYNFPSYASHYSNYHPFHDTYGDHFTPYLDEDHFGNYAFHNFA